MAEASKSDESQRSKARAWLQLLVGQLQIMGATAGFVLLLTIGARKETVLVVCITLALSLLSRLILHGGARTFRQWITGK